MAEEDDGENEAQHEAWEEEILAEHRWGQHRDRAAQEHQRLKVLWEGIGPRDLPNSDLLGQVIGLEVCNWRLEESILEICGAIGRNQPTAFPVGHGNWHSDDRMKEVWAFYLASRHWLAGNGSTGYEALLSVCDPANEVRHRVFGFLGEKDGLKELYVERFCLCLEYWLGDCRGRQSAQTKAHAAAAAEVEAEIRSLNPKDTILRAFAHEGDGKIPPCHHKLFRRYDIILSSIGTGKWRGGIPMRGTDGFERAALLESYLAPIQAWIDGRGEREEAEHAELFQKTHGSLGEPTPVKIFLASLLVSLLRSQQLAAVRLAEARRQT